MKKACKSESMCVLDGKSQVYMAHVPGRGSCGGSGNRKDTEIQKGQCGWSVEDEAEFVCVLLAYRKHEPSGNHGEVEAVSTVGQKHIQAACFCALLRAPPHSL